MTNYTIIKRIEKVVNDDDLVVFFGHRLCKVAYNFDKPNYIYVNKDSINLCFLIGFLFGFDKRIFIFCEDDFAIQYFNSFIEIRKYYHSNFHIFILKNNSVNNVFSSINHPQGSFFNIGFKSFKATPYFESVDECVKLKRFISSVKERSTFIVEFDNDTFDKHVIDIPKKYSIRDKIRSFAKSITKNSNER